MHISHFLPTSLLLYSESVPCLAQQFHTEVITCLLEEITDTSIKNPESICLNKTHTKAPEIIKFITKQPTCRLTRLVFTLHHPKTGPWKENRHKHDTRKLVHVAEGGAHNCVLGIKKHAGVFPGCGWLDGIEWEE